MCNVDSRSLCGLFYPGKLTPAGLDRRPAATPLRNLPNWNKLTSGAAAWQIKLVAKMGATRSRLNRRPKAWPMRPPKMQVGIVAKVGKLAESEETKPPCCILS